MCQLYSDKKKIIYVYILKKDKQCLGWLFLKLMHAYTFQILSSYTKWSCLIIDSTKTSPTAGTQASTHWGKARAKRMIS